MASDRHNKRALLNQRLEQSRPAIIGESDFARLVEEFSISESYLRKLLRASGVPLAPLVDGVRQDSIEDLERTLRAIGQEYAAATDYQRARRCRRIVIEAKDHAKFALRRGHAEKEEMVLWMLTWLENPGVFPDWVELRKARLATG